MISPQKLLILILVLTLTPPLFSAKKERTYVFGDEAVDQDKILEVYVGVGVTFWDVPATPGQGSVERFDEVFKEQIEPFIIKEADISFYNLYGFEGALNYLTSNLTGQIGFNNNAVVERGDGGKTARQLRTLLGWGTDDFLVQTEIMRRNFEGTMEFSADPDNVGPVYLYQFDRPPIELENNDRIRWFTDRVDYAARVWSRSKSSPIKGFAGYRHFEYVAPSSVTFIDPKSNIESRGNYVVSRHFGDFVELGAEYKRWINKNFYYNISLPLNVGISRLRNPYFENSFDLSRWQALVVGRGIIAYRYKTLSITAGYNLEWNVSQVEENLVLKQGIFIYHEGRSKPLPAGRKVRVESFRTELLHGPFIALHYIY